LFVRVFIQGSPLFYYLNVDAIDTSMECVDKTAFIDMGGA